MTDADLFEFNVIFADVRRVFPIRGDETDVRQLMASYFGAFKRYPLSRVRAGSEAWILHGKRWPKPAEWIESMPTPSVSVSVAIEALDQARADEWLHAERNRWEGRLCACADCRRANVTERPIRFVPEFTADDLDKKARIADRVVTCGHWAHGAELAGYYRAKEQFWTKFRALAASHTMRQTKKKQRFEERIDAIFKPRTPAPEQSTDTTREPGEEG